MSPLDWLAEPACRLLTLALLHFVWQGFAVALSLVVGLEFGHARKPATRYTCSLVALLLMAFCPIVTFAYLSTVQSSGAGAAEQLDSFSSHAVTRGVVAQQWLEAGQPLVLTAWLAGVALLASRLVGGAIGVARLRQSRLRMPAMMALTVDRLGKRLRLEAQSLVFLSHQVADAMAVGLIRPMVLIPAAWATEMPVE